MRFAADSFAIQNAALRALQSSDDEKLLALNVFAMIRSIESTHCWIAERSTCGAERRREISDFCETLLQDGY